MSKSAAQLPVVPFSYEEVMSGTLPSLFARMSVEHGPILKHVVQSGPFAGEEFVYMVGPDAIGSCCTRTATTLATTGDGRRSLGRASAGGS
jgi:hypothetical protein